MSSAICFTLGQSKTLSSYNGLKHCMQLTQSLTLQTSETDDWKIADELKTQKN